MLIFHTGVRLPEGKDPHCMGPPCNFIPMKPYEVLVSCWDYCSVHETTRPDIERPPALPRRHHKKDSGIVIASMIVAYPWVCLKGSYCRLPSGFIKHGNGQFPMNGGFMRENH